MSCCVSMKVKLFQVEYEQLWNVEDRNSRRLSSSEEEDTEEEAPGLSSSPLQVGYRRRIRFLIDTQEVGPVSLPPPARQETSSGARTVLTLAKKEGLPPAPPARPAKSHARSSSLGWFILSSLLVILHHSTPNVHQTCKRTDAAAPCPPCLQSHHVPLHSSAPSTPLSRPPPRPPPGRRPGICWAGTPRRSVQKFTSIKKALPCSPEPWLSWVRRWVFFML